MKPSPQFLVVSVSTDNGRPIKVVDVVHESTKKAYARCIMDERGGMYSAISVTGERRQPFLVAVQDIIDGWGIGNNPSRGLVLGYAGCAIPRYLLSSFESIQVDGVDISPHLIDIANEFFLQGLPLERLELIQSDAVTFCDDHAPSARYDLIVSDLFDGHRVLDCIYTRDFMANLRKMMRNDRSLFVANLTGIDRHSLSHIVECCRGLFHGVDIAHDGKRVDLVAYPSSNALTKELSDILSKYT